ncbi:MAG: hypothetical protein ABFR53_00255 [Actinomycetota bacterium]
MTMTTDDRMKIRKALGAYIDDAPPAPEWMDWEIHTIIAERESRTLSGPLVAATSVVAVLLVIGGLAGTLRLGSAPEAGTPAAWPATVGGWFDTVSDLGIPILGNQMVVQAELGPEPDFDTTDLGTEQPLIPATTATDLASPPWKYLVEYKDPAMTSQSAVVVVGRIGDVAAGAVTGNFTSESIGGGFDGTGLCHLVVGPALETPTQSWSTSAGCAPLEHPFESGVGTVDGLAVGTSSQREGAMFVGSVTMSVPPDTSVVVFESGPTTLWQRPRGGMALFVGTFAVEGASYVAYDASGRVIEHEDSLGIWADS